MLTLKVEQMKLCKKIMTHIEYKMVAAAKTANMYTLKMASTIEKIIRLISENKTLNDEPVRKDSIRLWSFIRCRISPVFLLSKNETGSFISLMRKSVRMEIFILVLICNNIQPRTNSTASRPANKAG